MKITRKKYKCTSCNCKIKEYETNHYGDTYNEHCNICESEKKGSFQTFKCLDAPLKLEIAKPNFKAFVF